LVLSYRPNEDDGIVACGGEVCRGAEFSYTVTELEMLSVVDALNKYRHFLLGRHFIIKSDHISLRFINNLKDSSVGRLFIWSLQIQGFDFELIYVKGNSHTIADSLSTKVFMQYNMQRVGGDHIFLYKRQTKIRWGNTALLKMQAMRMRRKCSYSRHGI